MPNRARGEVAADIGGQKLTLCLNIKTLASIEAAFEADSFEDVLADVLGGEKVSAQKLLRLWAAILEGNGFNPDLAGEMDPAEMPALSMKMLSLAFPEPKKGKGKTENPS